MQSPNLLGHDIRQLNCKQDVCISNTSVVTGICDPSKFTARHHHSFKIGSKFSQTHFKNFAANVARFLKCV